MLNKILISIFTVISSLSLYSQEQISLDLTIYSNNFGVIRDVRAYELTKGMNSLMFNGIPGTIIPQSIFLKFNGKILEQSFRNDIENANVFYNKLLNTKITLKKSGSEPIKGELLSYDYGFLIKTETGEMVLISDVSKYQVIAEDLPKDLVSSPTILWKINSENSGKQNLAINYLFDNIKWAADYVAILNENETEMDIDAKFTLTNNSGFAIKNATTNLISGKVNKSFFPGYQNNISAIKRGDALTASMDYQEITPEDLSDYQLYNLGISLNLDNNETKQLGMFVANKVKITRKKRYNAFLNNNNTSVNSFVSFVNDEKSGLGKLLPQGKMSFYNNRNGKPEFIGESQIPIKNIGDSLELYIGDIAGITSQQKTMNSITTDNYYENEIEITLTNRTDKDENVEIVIYKGYLGSVVKSSVKLNKIDANIEKCTVKVPKNSDFKMNYILRNSIVKNK
jgi:hypothetical protein